MADIILHHYDTSPYSEKVRLGFGLKGLAWASVELPQIMPKPNLTALTGGYRKTPVLQIGADIYCDSGRRCQHRPLGGRWPSWIPSSDLGSRGPWASTPSGLLGARRKHQVMQVKSSKGETP
jgi:hypothetical protein